MLPCPACEASIRILCQVRAVVTPISLLREFHFHAVLRLHRRTFEQKFASRLDEDRSVGRRGVGETEIVARFGLDGELRFGIVFLEPLAAFEADYRVRERGGNGL